VGTPAVGNWCMAGVSVVEPGDREPASAATSKSLASAASAHQPITSNRAHPMLPEPPLLTPFRQIFFDRTSPP
jgi:hypothetical protein